MIKRRMLIILLFLILTGCTNHISAEEAEQIAIEQAISEGYRDPQLFKKYDKKTGETYHFSVKENKDVKTWEVTLFTSEREQVEGLLGDLIYYVNLQNGEIVHKISGID